MKYKANSATFLLSSLLQSISSGRYKYCQQIQTIALRSKKSAWNSSLLVILSFSLSLALTTNLRAQTANTTPQELSDVLSQVETAANNRNLKSLMEFYSPNFTSSDGLNVAKFSQALKKTWQAYSKLNYSTQIQSWKSEGNQLVAETLTKVTGTQNNRGRVINLESNIKARQYFQDGKIVKQEILAEMTKLTSGNNPPQVEMTLPEKVKVGQKFDFDTIVKEPLGEKVLLGAVLEEKISSDRYLKPGTLQLEALSSGGIYKVAIAPATPEDRWFSAIVVRGDGVTTITQRVKIEK